MARRFDISDKLIHFTGGGECVDDAFARLRAIIREGRLIASSRMIRGGFRCVSFTEAPLPAFAPPFISEFPFTRYSPFGGWGGCRGVSVAVEKGTKMAARWRPATGAVRSEPFPLIRRRCSERPGAVKGAPLLGAAKRTLDGEDRSVTIRKRERLPAPGAKVAPKKWPLSRRH